MCSILNNIFDLIVDLTGARYYSFYDPAWIMQGILNLLFGFS